MLFLQVLLQIQSDQTQAPGICLHQIGGDCLTKCVQALKNPNPLKDDERLVVLVVVELSFR